MSPLKERNVWESNKDKLLKAIQKKLKLLQLTTRTHFSRIFKITNQRPFFVEFDPLLI